MIIAFIFVTFTIGFLGDTLRTSQEPVIPRDKKFNSTIKNENVHQDTQQNISIRNNLPFLGILSTGVEVVIHSFLSDCTKDGDKLGSCDCKLKGNISGELEKNQCGNVTVKSGLPNIKSLAKFMNDVISLWIEENSMTKYKERLETKTEIISGPQKS